MKLTKAIGASLVVAFLLGSGMLSAQPALVDGVVAVVGKNIVLRSQVNQQYESRMRQQQGNSDGSPCEVFEELLMEKLLLHQANEDSVTVSEDEVEMNIDRRIKVFVQQIGSRQRLEQYYKKTIPEIKEEMAPLIRDQMIAQRMMQSINEGTSVTPSEVREFYNKIPEDSLPLINAEVEYAEIVKFPEASQEARQETIDQLNGIKERIEEGSSFKSMAVLYSEDPGSAKSGGEYKGIKRGQFVDEFDAVAFNLQPGEISDPFETEYGYHIVQLQVKRGQELDLRHILIKPKIKAENLSKTEEFLDSLRTEIRQDSISFKEAARLHSDEESSRLNGGMAINPKSGDTRWEVGQLDKSVFYALESLSEGGVSEPVFFRTQDEKEGYRLVKLLRRSEAHVARLSSDYQRIQQVALSRKQDRVLDEWIEDKLKETYVRVNNEYLNCDFKQDWIEKTQYIDKNE